MSDDRVAPFDRKFEARDEPLVGTATFRNGALTLSLAPFIQPGPTWMVKGLQVRLHGRSELVPFHAELGCRDWADGSARGWVSENEHGMSAALHFDRPYYDLLQAVALSPVDLEIVLQFGANGEGEVSVLNFAIERKLA